LITTSALLSECVTLFISTAVIAKNLSFYLNRAVGAFDKESENIFLGRWSAALLRQLKVIGNKHGIGGFRA
jgi:hypothetical protein